MPVTEGILFVLFGILLLISTGANSNRPAGSLAVVYVFLALFLIIHGIVSFVGAIIDKGSPDRVWQMVMGVIAVVLGILAFVFPAAGVVTFSWLLIIFLLVSGILACLRAADFRKIKGSGWGWMLAFGILCILIALYCLIFPIIGAVAISFALLFWIGFLSIIAGAFLIWAGVKVKRMASQLATHS